MSDTKFPFKTLSFSPRTECPDFAEIVKQTTPDQSLFEQITACLSDRLEDFAKYYCRDDPLGPQ